MRKNHLSPFYRLERPLGYKIYFARHKNLTADFAWDNIDGQRPNEVHNETEIVSSTLVPTQQLALSDAIQQSIDSKFVVYAGYLHNQFYPTPQSKLHSFLISPLTFFNTTLPGHFGREHAALRVLNYLIADAISAQGNKLSYRLNDGISPITSSLLLKNDFEAQTLISNESDFKHIRENSNAKKARLFDNIDHLTFIESRRPAGLPQNVTDVLSNTEAARPMFAWILKDILE
jgi:hypothetical protein